MASLDNLHNLVQYLWADALQLSKVLALLDFSSQSLDCCDSSAVCTCTTLVLLDFIDLLETSELLADEVIHWRRFGNL